MAVDPETERELQEDAKRIFDSMGGNPMRIAMAAAQFKRFAQGAQPDALEVSGGVSAATGEPFVRFAFGGDYAIQQKPQESRDLALVIIEAAETAVSDAAIFKFARDALDADMDKAAQIVGLVRDHRRDRWGGA